MAMTARANIEGLTKNWYAATIVGGAYWLAAERFRTLAIVEVAALVPLSLGIVFVLGKKLLAGSSRTRTALVWLNTISVAYHTLLTGVLVGRFFDNPLLLIVNEGLKLAFGLLCLIWSARSLRALTGGSMKAYCRS